MQTIMLIAVNVLLILIFAGIVKIYLFIRPEKLAAGDMVIVNNPHAEERERNMITEVINILSPTCVQVRGIKTTISMHRKWVRKIPVRKDSPLRVPEEPRGEVRDWGNQAGFREIPLKWFSYDPPSKTT